MFISATLVHSLASRPILTVQSVSSSPSVPVEEPVLVADFSENPDGTLGTEVYFNIYFTMIIILTIDDSHYLSVLVTALSTVYQWFPLGIHLGLSYSKLKVSSVKETREDKLRCVKYRHAAWPCGCRAQRKSATNSFLIKLVSVLEIELQYKILYLGEKCSCF